jgi:UDP-N-acetylglucosamine 2-epimerase (non-hydrolysing)
VADEIIIHTGQHYNNEMNQIFFDELSIPDPDYNLEVGSGSHGWQTGEMLREIEKVLILERLDLVLVYGDCNTTLAGALASAKLKIPIGHVEAGCRTYQKVPEEINRRCVDHVSDLLFAISDGAAQTLKSEKVFGRVFNVGSTVVDACLFFSEIVENLMDLDEKHFVLTLHRPANIDMAREAHMILEAIYQIKEQVVFPIHPRTRKAFTNFGLIEKLANSPAWLS